MTSCLVKQRVTRPWPIDQGIYDVRVQLVESDVSASAGEVWRSASQPLELLPAPIGFMACPCIIKPEQWPRPVPTQTSEALN